MRFYKHRVRPNNLDLGFRIRDQGLGLDKKQKSKGSDLNVPSGVTTNAVGGSDDPPAVDQAAPAPDIVRVTGCDKPRHPGVLIDLSVHAPNNPSPSLGQATVA